MACLEPIKGFVLAGGKSRRMGQDKGLMRLGNQPMVLRAAGILKPFVQTVALLAPADRYRDLGLLVIADLWPDQGPLAALCTGLVSSDAEWNLFLACDLPCISSRFFELLVERIRTSNSDAVVPCTQEGWQPLAAAYHARCRPVFERAVQQRQLSIVQLFTALRAEAITPGELATAGVSGGEFFNVNTPQDWARVAGSREGTILGDDARVVRAGECRILKESGVK